MPLKVCGVGGCPRFAEVRGYCRVHASERRKETRSDFDPFYSSLPWKYARRRQLVDHPFCAECGRLADVVHHKVELTKGGAPRDPANLQSMCRACHSALHRRSAKAGF